MSSSNLTKDQKVGLSKIKSKTDTTVVFQTDKSGRLAVDSKSNYIAASKPHVVNDVNISVDDHAKAQEEINAHSIFWTRFLRAG